MTISFRIPPASARRAERRSQVVTENLTQVGSALPADGVRPVTRDHSTHDSTTQANARPPTTRAERSG